MPKILPVSAKISIFAAEKWTKNLPIVPFIITDELKMLYYRGLHEWGHIDGYLTDTCLTAQDQYKALLDYFKIQY